MKKNFLVYLDKSIRQIIVNAAKISNRKFLRGKFPKSMQYFRIFFNLFYSTPFVFPLALHAFDMLMAHGKTKKHRRSYRLEFRGILI